MHVMCVPHTLCTCTPVCLGGTTAVDDIFEVIIFSRSLVLALVSGFSRTPVGVRVVIGVEQSCHIPSVISNNTTNVNFSLPPHTRLFGFILMKGQLIVDRRGQ